MTQASRRGGRPSRWEWPVAIVSALLVVGTIGFLIVQGARSRDGARIPAITAAVDTVIATTRGYVVRVEVRNVGNAPAEAVHVVGETAGDSPERAETVIALLPVGSRQLIGLPFSRDPRVHTVTIRVAGFAIR